MNTKKNQVNMFVRYESKCYVEGTEYVIKKYIYTYEDKLIFR